MRFRCACATRTHASKQEQALFDRQAPTVTVLVDPHALHILHREPGQSVAVTPPSSRRAMSGCSSAASIWRSSTKRLTRVLVRRTPCRQQFDGNALAELVVVSLRVGYTAPHADRARSGAGRGRARPLGTGADFGSTDQLSHERAASTAAGTSSGTGCTHSRATPGARRRAPGHRGSIARRRPLGRRPGGRAPDRPQRILAARDPSGNAAAACVFIEIPMQPHVGSSS
jgi:hypothetical protein